MRYKFRFVDFFRIFSNSNSDYFSIFLFFFVTIFITARWLVVIIIFFIWFVCWFCFVWRSNEIKTPATATIVVVNDCCFTTIILVRVIPVLINTTEMTFVTRTYNNSCMTCPTIRPNRNIAWLRYKRTVVTIYLPRPIRVLRTIRHCVCVPPCPESPITFKNIVW
ncbi:Uncharacterised protein [Mycobacteroides abscessus subsp. abscessus]|nr:Uncharacterised protein [Mycobacteroides abscessus subsp. abscessus]